MPLKMICASHTPLMDHVEADPDVDAQVRRCFRDLAADVKAYDPDLIVIFAPDHFKGFFYDMLPPFTVGVRATSIGDYDIGGGELSVPEHMAVDCIHALHRSGVDIVMSYRMQADHGFAQLLVLLSDSVERYPVLPIHINCAGPPLPPFKRVRELGTAVGTWAAGLNKRVLILGSGGLSHDPPIPSLKRSPPDVVERLIAGYTPTIEERRAREQQNFEVARALAKGQGDALPLSPEWDRSFMDSVARGDLTIFDALPDEELTRRAGCGGHEVRTWIAAYAALGSNGPFQSEKLFYRDIPAWNAGMGIAIGHPKEQLPSHGQRAIGEYSR